MIVSGNSIPDQLSIKKAFEISYALIRLADTASGNDISAYLRRLGLDLLYSATMGEHANAQKALRAIEYMVRLAGSTGVVSSLNSEMVSEEANGLYEHITKLVHVDGRNGEKELDLSLVFSKEGLLREEGDTSTKGADVPHEGGEQTERKSETNLASQERQVAILGRIRQSGNSVDGKKECRMKDIQEMFPHISERTLRYDIQSLVEKGLVERVGLSGPATYYRAREVSTV